MALLNLLFLAFLCSIPYFRPSILKATFLLLNLALIALPLFFFFNKKLRFYKNWKVLLVSLLTTLLLFSVWTVLFTSIGIWSFNENYYLGALIMGVPFEEFLLTLSYGFTFLFIYELLHFYFPNKYKIPNLYYILLLGVIFCVVSYFQYVNLFYSACVLIISSMVLLLHGLSYKKKKYLDNFYRAMAATFIPITIIEVVISYVPIRQYNEMEKTNRLLMSMPREQILYLFILFSILIGIYEGLRKRRTKING